MTALPLPFAKPHTEIVITTRTICTECTPQRAQRVAAFLVERGWNAVYGGQGATPDNALLYDEAFTVDFYAATSRILS